MYVESIQAYITFFISIFGSVASAKKYIVFLMRQA